VLLDLERLLLGGQPGARGDAREHEA